MRHADSSRRESKASLWFYTRETAVPRTAQWTWLELRTSCRRQGWTRPRRWCQRYVHWAEIISVTSAGTTRAFQCRVGVPLGPRVCLYQKIQYMEGVGPGHTGLRSVLNNGVELAFDTERYSNDAVVPAATKEALVAMLSQQDGVAPKFTV